MFRNHLKPAALAAGFLLVLAFISSILFYLRTGAFPPFNECLCFWDCNWYDDLAKNGYVLKADAESNPGFFPLFPMMWRFFGLNYWQVSLLNLLLFASSFAALCVALRISFGTQLKFLAIGLVTFFMIPYSESLFFLGSSLLLIGLYQKEYSLLIPGFFIAVMARSAAIIFIADAAVLILYSMLISDVKNRVMLIVSIVITVLTTLVVFSIQYLQTGDFFAFFYAQQFWDHHFGAPSIPFTSWHWPTHVSDACSLIVGLTAILVVLTYAYDRFFSSTAFARKLPGIRLFSVSSDLNYASLFSLLYLAGTTATILLFQGGNLHSLNRYIFSTPYFLVMLYLFSTSHINIVFSYKHYALFCVLVAIVMPHGMYVEHYFIILLALLVIPGAVLFGPQHFSSPWAQMLIKYVPLILGFLFQLQMLVRYFGGSWMG
jgi:hypothetical protein